MRALDATGVQHRLDLRRGSLAATLLALRDAAGLPRPEEVAILGTVERPSFTWRGGRIDFRDAGLDRSRLLEAAIVALRDEARMQRSEMMMDAVAGAGGLPPPWLVACGRATASVLSQIGAVAAVAAALAWERDPGVGPVVGSLVTRLGGLACTLEVRRGALSAKVTLAQSKLYLQDDGRGARLRLPNQKDTPRAMKDTPCAIVAAMAGRPLAQILTHQLLDPLRLTVRRAETRSWGLLLTLDDPIVPLAPIPADAMRALPDRDDDDRPWEMGEDRVRRMLGIAAA